MLKDNWHQVFIGFFYVPLTDSKTERDVGISPLPHAITAPGGSLGRRFGQDTGGLKEQWLKKPCPRYMAWSVQGLSSRTGLPGSHKDRVVWIKSYG